MTDPRHPQPDLIEITAASPNAAVLRTAYDKVLRPSFPVTQLASFEVFVTELSESPEEAVLVAVDGDSPVGVAVDYPMPELGLGLLAYAATRPGHRSRGIGGFLMRALRERWAAGPVDLVLAEVEDPRFHADTSENRSVARLRFYERHGAEVLMVPWVQPGLDGNDRVPGMLLLRVWVRGPAETVPATTLVRWADVYFSTEEGGMPEDATFLALRARVTERSAVAVAPVGDATRVLPLEAPTGG